MRRVVVLTLLSSGAAFVYAGARAPDAANEVAPARERTFGRAEEGPQILLNGLAENGLLGDLGLGALTSTALENDPRIRELLALNPKLLTYLVECALAEGQSVSVDDGAQVHVFEGAGGLAPEWADGPCTEACQEWVSACLFARTNIYGIPVRIFISGTHPALNAEEQPDDGAFLEEEGAFYGNLFLDPYRAYTCRGAGNDPLYLGTRVCTLPGNRCGYQSLGPCGPIDGDTGLGTRRHACEAYEDGVYRRCHNRLSTEGSGEFPEPNKVYDRVLGVRVRRSTFQGGVHAACAGGAPDGGVVDPPDSGLPPPTGITAGRQCAWDEDCASNTLYCDVTSPQPMCTSTCAQSLDQRVEQGQCGGVGSTCLEVGPGFGVCTGSCIPGRPSEALGGCAPNRICTGLWLQREVADRTGCFPFCQADGDCAQGTRCNPRVGACGEPADETKLPDGEPCSATAAENECRGGCILTSTTSEEVGNCFSVINLARTERCPDDPDDIPAIFPRGEDMGVCVFRQCATSADCTPPHRCRPGPAGFDGCMP